MTRSRHLHVVELHLQDELDAPYRSSDLVLNSIIFIDCLLKYLVWQTPF